MSFTNTITAIRTATLPKPYRPWGVGKHMGKHVYLHATVLEHFGIPKETRSLILKFNSLLPHRYPWSIVKLKLTNPNELTFLCCDDFHNRNEPEILHGIRLVHEHAQWIPGRNYVYHHKWLMVPNPSEDDQCRTLAMAAVKYDRAKSGQKCYWEPIAKQVDEICNTYAGILQDRLQQLLEGARHAS